MCTIFICREVCSSKFTETTHQFWRLQIVDAKQCTQCHNSEDHYLDHRRWTSVSVYISTKCVDGYWQKILYCIR